MSYVATVNVTGSRKDDFDDEFFNQSIEVTADTIGGVYDLMVEAAYYLYEVTKDFVADNFISEKHAFSDFWYVNCSYPDVHSSGSVKNDNGSGSALSSSTSILSAVIHYRHLAISEFFNTQSKRLKDGYYAQFLNVRPEREYMNLWREDNPNKWAEYGYTGALLDEVIRSMGPYYQQLINDYNNIRGYYEKRENKFVKLMNFFKGSVTRNFKEKV